LLGLSNSALYPRVYYELNLEFTDTSGSQQLYPVPVLITNFENIGSNSVNQGECLVCSVLGPGLQCAHAWSAVR